MREHKELLHLKGIRRVLTGLLMIALVVSTLSGMGMIVENTAQAAGIGEVALHNPVYDSGMREVEPGAEEAVSNIHNPVYHADTDETTWDCVWFGNYWQSDTNGDGVADKKDDKEPIKWRVLWVDGDDVFLLADKNLDVKPYNEEYTDVTWETCTLRSWLNGYGGSANGCGRDYTSDNFINNAFSATEQAAIIKTNVANEDNPWYGTEGGNNTMDKLWLLSIKEASNSSYGFCSVYRLSSEPRMALNTAYVADYESKDGSMNAVGEADWWWLRSPGDDRPNAATVTSHGYGDCHGSNGYGDYAIRPALHLTLSSSTPLSYAGTVCSDGTVTDADGNIVAGPAATPVPTDAPTAGPTTKPTPTGNPTVIPTAEPTPKGTAKPTVKPPGSGERKNTPAPGQVVKDADSKAFYQMVSTGTQGTVSFLRPESKLKKAKVPAVIYHEGKKYKVTSIAPKAFAGNKKLKTVVIGKNVRIIGKKAFANCNRLSKVTVNSKVLSKVAKNAFKGTNKKLTVKVSKKKRAKYKKLFKGKGKLRVK